MDYPSDSAVRLHNGKFTDGDPINSIPASKDPAAHQNALTDEILAVISARGLTPDEADLTQLLKSIDKPFVGGLQGFAMSTPPVGWLKANGAEVSRTAYADLFAAIGETYGNGDGSTTFNLPDVRGDFIRAWDDGRGVDSDRALGSFQESTGVGGYTKGSGSSAVYAPVANSDGPITIDTGDYSHLPGSYAFTGPTVASHKVRPRNTALLICIKY